MYSINEAIKKLEETKKEDDLYFQGAFWIAGDSLNAIKEGNFAILVGSKILSTYYGDIVSDKNYSKSELTHKKLWKSLNKQEEWDCYPRGRVAIDQGTAYVHLNSVCATDAIKDAIVNEYQLNGLRIVYDYNNEYQGSHYNFLLK